jgi:hypothetical protein
MYIQFFDDTKLSGAVRGQLNDFKILMVQRLSPFIQVRWVGIFGSSGTRSRYAIEEPGICYSNIKLRGTAQVQERLPWAT